MATYKRIPVQPEIAANLLDRHTKQFVDAVVVSDFTEAILLELERWPLLLSLLRRLDGSHWSDSGWKWRTFYENVRFKYPRHVVEFYAVIADDRAQGAMMVLHPDASKRMNPSQPQVLHVARIATAPSNRNHITGSSPRFKGVGKALMLVAGARSHELGLNGYVSLLSVKKSVDFYEQEMKMTSFADEVDDEEELIYFEDVISEGYIKSD